MYYPYYIFLLPNRLYNHSEQYNDHESLIRNLNHNKAIGPDGISGQILLLCDNLLLLPLNILFQNILVISKDPDKGKLANVSPICKKDDKQLIKNYRSISLLPTCGKIFEKIIFNNLHSYLSANNLLTKTSRVFVQAIPQPTNCYILSTKSTRLLKTPSP